MHEAVEALLDEAASSAELAGAYAAYQRLLAERSLIDHGDQVAEAVRLLDERPAVRLSLRRRFRYVVVDEAQDANRQQMRLVRRLVGARGNVMFVGDDDQAIYSFRGAVGQGLAGLDASYDSVKDVVLRRNYRSHKPILEAARRLIRHNDPDRLEVQRGLDKTLTAVRRARRPALVAHHAYRTVSDEADAVAADIKRRLEHGTAPGAMAVLVRTKPTDAAPVLASLDVVGIPRRFSGASGLLAHREVRDVMSLMRTIAAPGSSEDLYGLLTSEPYGLGGEDLTLICETAESEASQPLGADHRSGRAARPAARLGQIRASTSVASWRTYGNPSSRHMNSRPRSCSTTICGGAAGSSGWWLRPSEATTDRCGVSPACSRSSRSSRTWSVTHGWPWSCLPCGP